MRKTSCQFRAMSRDRALQHLRQVEAGKSIAKVKSKPDAREHLLVWKVSCCFKIPRLARCAMP